MPNSNASARVSNSRDGNTKEAFISPHSFTFSSVYERSFGRPTSLIGFVRVKSNDSPRPSTLTYPREVFERTTFKMKTFQFLTGMSSLDKIKERGHA